MTKQELADVAAKAARQLLKEFQQEHGVYFEIGGCCVCSDSTLDVVVLSDGNEVGAYATVFTYDI